MLHRNLEFWSMNQNKLVVVKQEMARVNTNILGISKLKWTRMGEFNSVDHYIYYCGQDSLRIYPSCGYICQHMASSSLPVSVSSPQMEEAHEELHVRELVVWA